eukprot:Rmarinus@m.23776
MAKLGRSIDELEVDLLESAALGLGEERLPQSKGTLLRTSNAALEHNVVLRNLTVVGEATKGGDVLQGDIELSSGVVFTLLRQAALSEAVNLLVDFSTVVVTILTCATNTVRNTSRMPGSDTSNLAETLVSLARKLFGAPTVSDTLRSVTLRNANDIDHLVLIKHSIDSEFLLEETVREVNLVLNGPAIHLKLDEMGLALAEVNLANLSVGEHANDLAVLLDRTKIVLDGLATIGIVLRVLGKGMLFRLVPVLVESATALIGNMLGPHRLQRTETTRSLNVSNNTNHNHRRGFDHGNGLDSLLLVKLRPGPVHITHNVGHASLVPNEASKVRLFALVILRETLDLTAWATASLARQEPEGTMARSFELPVRHF